MNSESTIRKIKTALFCFASISFVGCDQVTKNLAKEHLMNHGAVSYFNDLFVLYYAENTGAAMGLGDALPQVLSFLLLGILPLLFLIALSFYIIKHMNRLSPLLLTGLTFVFAGGIGNIIDRLLHDRHVTDFMIMGIGKLHTGIFNFSDLYISTGAIILLIYILKLNIAESKRNKLEV